MRSRVVFPAPFVPRRATDSPSAISNEIPRRAGEVGAAKGCRKARQPPKAGGNDFERESTLIAEAGTAKFITCLKEENNLRTPVGKVAKWRRDGRERQSPVR